MIWDFCPDVMHIIKTFFDRLVLGVFSGERRPTFNRTEPKKPEGRLSPAERAKWKKNINKYNARAKEYADAIKAFDECLFSTEAQRTVDERVQNLVGYPYWIRGSMVHSHSTTRTRTQLTNFRNRTEDYLTSIHKTTHNTDITT
jgi:hypothetical protein